MKRKYGAWQKAVNSSWKKFYQRLVRRRNRHAAKRKPNSVDKRLNPWSVD